MSRIVKIIIGTIAALGSVSTASAETMVAPTLEWLADHCPDSGVYEVERVQAKPDKTKVVHYKLKSVLRGDPPRTLNRSVAASQSPARADEHLIAFQRYKDRTARALQIIDLGTPATRGSSSIAVNSQLELLTDRKSIMKTFRARLKKRPKADPVLVGDYSKDNRFELDLYMSPFAAIYGGSSCYLRVPIDLVKTAAAAARAQRKIRASKTRGR